MKIILSPAKKMNINIDTLEPIGLPTFIDKSTEILAWLKDKSKDELKELWKCNNTMVEQNVKRIENMDLYHRLTPAILSYEGIAYQYMAPAVFEYGHFDYIQEHLRILSAFYGSSSVLIDWDIFIEMICHRKQSMFLKEDCDVFVIVFLYFKKYMIQYFYGICQ